MDICYVCGNILSGKKICPLCGFDTSADAENYPSLQPVSGGTSIAEQQNRRIQAFVQNAANYRHEAQEKLIRSLFEEAFKKFEEEEKKQIKAAVESAVREESEKLLKTLKENPVFAVQPPANVNAAVQQQTSKNELTEDSKQILQTQLASKLSAAAEKQAANKDVDPPISFFANRVMPGDKVTLGNFDGPIEWTVLEKDSSSALLLCNDILDERVFHTAPVDTSWAKCALRSWLNNDFYNAAFSENEKQAIITDTVKAQLNPQRPSSDPGTDTKDAVFLLSYVEADKFPVIKEIGDITKNRTKNSVNTKRPGYWWLRSPGWATNIACYVTNKGNIVIFELGSNVTQKYGIRPSIRIKLK